MLSSLKARLVLGFVLSPMLGLLISYGSMILVFSIISGDLSTLVLMMPVFFVGILGFGIPSMVIWPLCYKLLKQKHGITLRTFISSAALTATIITALYALLEEVPDAVLVLDRPISEILYRFITLLFLIGIAALPAGWIQWHVFIKITNEANEKNT